MQYSSVKLPSDVDVLVFNNLKSFFSTSAMHETNISEIYFYGNSLQSISLNNNKAETIIVYHTTEYHPYVHGAENIEYVKI